MVELRAPRKGDRVRWHTQGEVFEGVVEEVVNGFARVRTDDDETWLIGAGDCLVIS